MAISFRVPFTVIKRNMGTFQNGVYIPDDNVGTQITVMADVQMPSSGDMQQIESYPYGQRAGRHIKIYTETRLQPVSQSVNQGEKPYPGDLFLYDNRTYLIFGEADFTMLRRTRQTQVSHYRYYACEIIEGSVWESTTP